MARSKKQTIDSPVGNTVDPQPNDNPKTGYGVSGGKVPAISSDLVEGPLEVLVEVRLRFVTPTVNSRPGEALAG